jgi:hypothetical protein
MELKTWGHVNGQIEQHTFRLKPRDIAKYFVQSGTGTDYTSGTPALTLDIPWDS